MSECTLLTLLQWNMVYFPRRVCLGKDRVVGVVLVLVVDAVIGIPEPLSSFAQEHRLITEVKSQLTGAVHIGMSFEIFNQKNLDPFSKH